MEEPLESFDMEPPTPKAPIGKVMLVNFAIMLIYIATSGKRDDYLILKALLIAVHFFITLIVGFGFYFSKSHQPLGRALLLSALMIPVVGFGMCLAKAEYF